MKNRKTAYFLVPVVLAIWGMIGWKVYAAIGGNNKDSSIPSVQKKVKPSASEISDTIELIANYRDPFLDKSVVINDNSKPKIQNSKLPQVKVADPPNVSVSWPKIIYHGLIRKSGSEKTLGFLSVDGKSHFVQMGDEAGEVKVGKIWKDSVEVFFGDKGKNFKK